MSSAVLAVSRDPIQGLLDPFGPLAPGLGGLELGDPVPQRSDLVLQRGHAGSSSGMSRAQSLIAGRAPTDLELVEGRESSVELGSEVLGPLRDQHRLVSAASSVASIRDAVFTVSPITAYSSRRDEPTLPDMTGPELIPIPIRNPADARVASQSLNACELLEVI